MGHRGQDLTPKAMTLEDVGRELGDLGDWASLTLSGGLAGPLTAFANALGLVTVGIIAAAVGVFLYWCVSERFYP